jgi:hypothetical protein
MMVQKKDRDAKIPCPEAGYAVNAGFMESGPAALNFWEES